MGISEHKINHTRIVIYLIKCNKNNKNFGFITKNPMFVVAYWFTNVVGFVMMHHGVKNLFLKDLKKSETKKEIKKTLLVSTVYTGLIIILIFFGLIKFPDEFLSKLTN